MRKNYTNVMMIGMLAAAMTGSVGMYAADDTSDKTAVRVAINEVHGDPMYGGTEITERKLSFYDSNNRLLRQSAFDKDGALIKYYTYNYNAAGQLSETFSRQYNIQQNGSWGLNDPVDKTTYKYDTAGRLVEKTGDSNKYKYTYDSNGNLLTEEFLMNDWATGELTRQTLTTYSDFKAKDCPQKVKVESIYESDSYEGDIIYNAQNLFIKETDYTVANGNRTYKKSKRCEYDANGNLTLTVRHQSEAIWDDDYMNITGYKEVPVDSIVYTADGDNRRKEMTWTYDSYGKEWMEPTTYNVEETRTFNGSLATTGHVEKMEGKLNTNIFYFNIPAFNHSTESVSNPDNYVFDIYRDGIRVCRYYPQDIAQQAGFIDAGVVNGNHDYFVQTVLVKNGVETEYNISDLDVVENNVALPAPTNLHGVSKKVTDETSYMTYAWDAPAYTDEMRFIGYNVMTVAEYEGAPDGCENAETPNIQETQYTSEMFNYYTEKNIYIQAVYALGVANSEPVKIKMSELPDVSSIKSMTTENGVVSYFDNTLILSEPANVTVNDMSGMKMAEAKNVKTMSLSQLPQGAYAVTIEKGGKLVIVKLKK